MLSTVAPSSPIRLRRRSWVIGRAIWMPSSSVAIAVASSSPIQIGRFIVLSPSRKITIGVLVAGSRVSPPTLIKIESSGPIRVRSYRTNSEQKETGRSIQFARFGRACRRGSMDEAIDDPIQLVEVAALLDQIAE